MSDSQARHDWRAPDLGREGSAATAGGSVPYFESGGGDRTIVFVHGVFANANLWRRVVPLLAPEFRCVALDLPLGSHRDAVGPDADVSPPGLADRITGAIEALGLEDIALVGNDTGGALCQIAITRHPERVGRLVLTSCDYGEHLPPPGFAPIVQAAQDPARLRAILAPLEDRVIRHLPAAYGSIAMRPIDDDASDSYALPAVRDDAVFDDLCRVLRGLEPEHALRAAERLGAFTRPVLIAWSREDQVFPTSDAEALAAAFPQATLEWIDDAYALSPEDQPARVAELVGAFARQPAGVP